MAAPSIYGALSSQPAAPLIHLHPPIHTKNTETQKDKDTIFFSLDSIPDMKHSKTLFYWLVTLYVEGQVTRWRTTNPYLLHHIKDRWPSYKTRDQKAPTFHPFCLQDRCHLCSGMLRVGLRCKTGCVHNVHCTWGIWFTTWMDLGISKIFERFLANKRFSAFYFSLSLIGQFSLCHY